MAVSGSFAARLAVWCALITGPTARKYCFALADQVLVSGSRFFTTIIVGRACGADELGVYALGFSVVMLLSCVQHSLVSGPYAVYFNRLRGGAQSRYTGSVLVQYIGLALAAAVVMGVAGVALLALGMPQLGRLFCLLVPLIPLLLLREFARQIAFGQLSVRAACLLDFVATIIQVSGLLLLWSTATLSAATAYGVTAAGCAIAGSWWLYAAQDTFRWDRRQFRPAFWRNWHLGRWDVAAQITFTVQCYGVYWLLAALSGPAATGVYTACVTLVMFANPFVLGMNSVFVPQAARAFAQQGRAGLRVVVFRMTCFLVAGMAVFALIAVAWSDPLQAALYGSGKYDGHMPIIAVMALSALMMVVTCGMEVGLWVVERPDATFRATLLSMVVTMTAGVPLILLWGVMGAALAVLLGRLCGAPWLWTAYRNLVRSAHVAP